MYIINSPGLRPEEPIHFIFYYRLLRPNLRLTNSQCRIAAAKLTPANNAIVLPAPVFGSVGGGVWHCGDPIG